jgi:NAD(P)H dehydrogenase (quinone)
MRRKGCIMKIGIIVHSRTGNTHAVAEKIRESLQAAGHSAEIEQVRPAGGEQPRGHEIRIEDPPDPSGYDALVFGAPVHGFTLSQEMATYLTQIPSLQGKRVACFVTKGLPFFRTGGNQAISKMRTICESKGATICGTGIIVWSQQREEKISALAEELTGCFAGIPA